ncbi:MAG TPA: preprotein translocase subunit YajC [Alphaproteobacteria bacterium]|nr:preprotein translocase subunit YajC [Alphaproteobacteria bacterium]
MWISQAFAQTATETSAPAQNTSSMLMSVLPLVLIFVIFYFLLIRPQQRKMRAHRAMVSGLRRGDKILTSGGIIGVVHKVLNDGEIQVEIAEGVRVRIARGSVNEILSRTGDGKDQDNQSEDKKDLAIAAPTSPKGNK